MAEWEDAALTTGDMTATDRASSHSQARECAVRELHRDYTSFLSLMVRDVLGDVLAYL